MHLSDSPELLFSAFDQAPPPIALLDLDGRCVLANQAMQQMLNSTDNDLAAVRLRTIAHPDETDSPLQTVEQLTASGAAPLQFLKRWTGETSQRWIVVTASLIRNSQLQPSHLLLHLQDVTDSRRAQWLETDRRVLLEMVAQDQPLPPILVQAVRLIERQLPSARACVMMLQDGVVRPFQISLPSAIADVIAAKPVSIAADLAGKLESSSSALRLYDLATDASLTELRDPAASAGLNACCATTLLGSHDRLPLGVLAVFRPSVSPLDPEESDVIVLAGQLAAIAIEHHETTRQLAQLLQTDALTGLPNRILFEDRLNLALSAAHRSGKPLGILAMDLNRFKQVNDTLGHQAGDALLQQFAKRLRPKLRASDTLARVGGDEFVMILPEITGREEAEQIVERLHEALAAAPFEIAGKSLAITSSIGIAIWPADGQDALLLQHSADLAMYRAKQQSKQGRLPMPLPEAPGNPPIPSAPAA